MFTEYALDQNSRACKFGFDCDTLLDAETGQGLLDDRRFNERIAFHALFRKQRRYHGRKRLAARVCALRLQIE